jgi:hypothetical protein
LLQMVLSTATLQEQEMSDAQGAFAVAGKPHPDLGVVLTPFLHAPARGVLRQPRRGISFPCRSVRLFLVIFRCGAAGGMNVRTF